MSSIRTTNQLFDALIEVTTWRSQELRNLRILLATSKSPLLETLLRASCALAYAHLEGFLRDFASTYTEFLTLQRVETKHLAFALRATALRSVLQKAAESSKYPTYSVNLYHLERAREGRARFAVTSVLPKNTNIGGKELLNSLRSLGLNSTLAETSVNFVTINIRDQRNEVAHGKESYPTDAEAKEIIARVLDLITEICDLCMENTLHRRYLKNST
jgi:hypothetical protein